MAISYDDEIYFRQNGTSDMGSVVEGGTGYKYGITTATGNGVTTAYVLSNTPSSAYPVFVYLAGVLQADAAWSLSVATVTFATAPTNGVAVKIVYTY